MRIYCILFMLFTSAAQAATMDSDGNIIRAEPAEQGTVSDSVNITAENDEATRGATVENENSWYAPQMEAWSSGQFGAQPADENAAGTGNASGGGASDVEVQEQGGMTIRTKDGHYIGADGLTIHAGDGRYIMPDGSLFIDQGEDIDLPPTHLPYD